MGLHILKPSERGPDHTRGEELAHQLFVGCFKGQLLFVCFDVVDGVSGSVIFLEHKHGEPSRFEHIKDIPGE